MAISHHGLAFIEKLGNPSLDLQLQTQQIFSIYRATVDLPERVDKAGEWRLDEVEFDKYQQT
jgi:hypothetical protein